MISASIITIGDEILIGQITDTNSAWLAQAINSAGITVVYKCSAGDNRISILKALKDASEIADVILITGGLGPTSDDITRNVLYEYFGSKPVMNPDVLKQVKRFLAQRNAPINERNERQAMVADNCTVIPNEAGTAPGMWFEKNNKVYVAMPGVPFEMKQMTDKYLLDMLKKRFVTPAILHRTILTTGIAESVLAGKIEEWEKSLPQTMKLAYLPSPGIVRLRISAEGNSSDILIKETDSQIEKLKKIIPQYIFGFDTDTIEGVVGILLKNRKKTLSVAESCTGGNIGHMITSVPGSSEYFKGGIIAYANEIKKAFLNVPDEILNSNGAVSKEVVTIMAKEVMKQFGTDYSIAVSGIAGPGGGTSEKPVGTTWIAVSSSSETIAEQFYFGEERGRNITRASIAALNMLRKCIINR